MSPENFTYWLRGFLELRGNSEPISSDQVKMIEAHLASVFDNQIMVTEENPQVSVPNIPVNTTTFHGWSLDDNHFFWRKSQLIC